MPSNSKKMDSELAIKLDNLQFSYREGSQEIPVLQNINLTVRRGEMIALQGPSGSGKSTLFYILGGLLRPTSGTVIVANCDLSDCDDKELASFRSKHLGFVFQQFHLLPRASVIDNILLPALYSGLPRKPITERAQELARRLDLGDRMDHYPNQLSGGQQQRVAIARALLLDADIILADEPTGNLDSQRGAQVLEVLHDLNRQGKTIVIITHDPEVASQCHRQISIRDGLIDKDSSSDGPAESQPVKALPVQKPAATKTIGLASEWILALPTAWANLGRNKVKSLLTMLGITLGTAAVLAVITLGEFTKRRILDGYETLGVNRINFWGDRNWRDTKTDPGIVPFSGLTWQHDLQPLRTRFPEIAKMSPVMDSWKASVIYGGRTATDQAMKVLGVGDEYLDIANGAIAYGKSFSTFNVEERDPVCVIGNAIPRSLGEDRSILGKVISVTINQNSAFPCRVIGVLKDHSGNTETFQPNQHILVPFTYYQILADRWSSQIRGVALKMNRSEDIDGFGKQLKKYFQLKYGNSAEFRVDSDSTLVSQMKRFLSIFSLLLTGIALLSLLVGGIGIYNMMMVSIAERIREIGLRKAVGASSRSIRTQVFAESILLSVLAGAIGIIFGFGACAGLMYAATKIIPNLKFEWVFDLSALTFSLIAVAITGILSGLAPALKAEKLQVIEALRSE
jgi:macrolide transport system ATP-binding/permease protein